MIPEILKKIPEIKVRTPAGKRAQSIVEYVVMFVVMMAAVLAVFFDTIPFRRTSREEGERDNFFTRMRVKSAFEKAVNQAITEFDKQ